jgi:hypothetical protein
MNNQGQSVKLTKDEFREHWPAFCDCDPVPVEDFADKAEEAGFIYTRGVEEEDLERSFAAELGIEPGGLVYDLTPAGRAALEQPQ